MDRSRAGAHDAGFAPLDPIVYSRPAGLYQLPSKIAISPGASSAAAGLTGVVGIALRLSGEGALPGWRILGALVLGVAAAFLVISWSDATNVRRHRVACWENRVLDGVLGPLTSRDWYVFPLAFAFTRRLRWFIPAAAIGAQVFWMLTLLLLVRVLRAA